MSLARTSFVLIVALLLCPTAWAADVDPEPANPTKEEAAFWSVDLDKAKKDKKLAEQILKHESASLANLRMIGQAVHEYYDAKKVLPDNLVVNKKPLLSWRVLILPYVGQKALYEKFKLDEPWDSVHNRALIVKMPEVFRSPRARLKGKGNTVYQAFTGKDAVFGRGQQLGLANIPDGTSNTIMAVESATGVPWTKPGGLPFDRAKALPAFGRPYGDKPLAVLFDGSVRVLDLKKIQPATLKNAIDPADGNVLGNDW